MIEKVINLENISLTDFLGVDNSNIDTLSKAFPKSKIISRGTELRIKGSPVELSQINKIINSLLMHLATYGKLDVAKIQDIIEEKQEVKTIEKRQEVILYGTSGFVVKPRSDNQLKIVQAEKKHDLLFVLGPAGTGKTYIAVALAVRALKNKDVKKIIITRPAVEAGENLGFLPGTMIDKIDPYLRPIYDALGEMIPSEKLKYFMESNTIEVAPLAYMRGRTLDNAFVLLDEAQNTTTNQLKMVLTRMGPKSKMMVNGDLTQIDLPGKQKSGLQEAVSKLSDVSGIGFVHLNGKDVVRHKLVRKIIEAYENKPVDEA